MRKESDFLGTVALADDFPFGIHTYRAMENFSFSSERVRLDLFVALVEVKKSAALANREAGLLDPEMVTAIVEGCDAILADPEERSR